MADFELHPGFSYRRPCASPSSSEDVGDAEETCVALPLLLPGSSGTSLGADLLGRSSARGSA